MITDKKTRQLAVAWLKSGRSFSQGIQILMQTGFKPGVVAKLHRVGADAPEAAERLVYLMREYIDVFGKPDVPDTDPVLHVFDGLPSPEDTADEESKAILYRAKRGKNPPRVGKIISEYASLYRKREKAFRQLTELGEDNGDETVRRRKALSDTMEQCTDRMEQLYPFFCKHIETGEDITEDEAESVAVRKTAEAPMKTEDTQDELQTMSVEELRKLVLKKSQARSKAKSWLKYQSPQPKPEPDPMPDCAARIKYEKKIKRLDDEIEQIRRVIEEKTP